MQAAVSGKSILITGGCGFIGSHLCDSFISAGNRVRCLDNLSTGKEENIAQLRGHADFEFVEGDIRELDTCRQAVEGMDLVLHQAALGSVPRSIKDPITTHAVNSSGFLHILEASRQAGISRFVYASSSSTYGDSPELPKVEARIGRPLSPYAVTKYTNELYAGQYASLHGMEIIGLRYFNVFGARQRPDGEYAAAIPRFVQALLRGESPLIYGSGLQSRDFTYIANVVQINHLAAGSSKPEALNQIYNVACGERYTVLQVIETLKELLAPSHPAVLDIPLRFLSKRTGDIAHSHADITKAITLLKYQPTHSMQQGLAEAISWYSKHLPA